MCRESLVLLPRPRRLIRSGEGFRLPPDTRIAFRGPDQDLVPIAAEIKRDLLELQGLRARVEAGGPGGDEAAIELLLGDDEDLPAEGYTLDIRSEGVRLRASGAPGAYYRAMTLRQVLRQADGILPGVRIHDRPDLPSRVRCWTSAGTCWARS